MKRPINCSFCGKSNETVFLMISSPIAFICDECVEICQEMVAVERLKRPSKKRWPAAERSPFDDHFKPQEQT